MTSSENAARLLPLAEAHAAADDYVSGTYSTSPGTYGSTRFKGCSIGCTIYDAKTLGMVEYNCDYGDHNAIARLIFGDVLRLATLQDAIFERLPDSERSQWTPRLLRAIARTSPKTNWKHVWHRWCRRLLTRLMKPDNAYLDSDAIRAIDQVRSLHATSLSNTPTISDESWRDCAKIARDCSNQSLRSGDAYLVSRMALRASYSTTGDQAIAVLSYASLAKIKTPRIADMFIEAIMEEWPTATGSDYITATEITSQRPKTQEIVWRTARTPTQINTADYQQLLASTKAAQKALIAAMKHSSSVPPGLHEEMMTATILLQDSLNLLKDSDKPA